jgi:transcription initiation factor TFIIE subunit beta
MSASSNLLEQQMRAFRGDMSSAGSKLAQKRPSTATPSSRPSPAPSSSSAVANAAADLKRKRPEPPANTVVYSQPANTSTGKHLMTQITYAVEYLKSKLKAMTFDEIFSYLSVQGIDERGMQTMQHILQTHSKVEFDKSGFGGKGSYRFRPMHNVRSPDQLEAYLQSQTTAQGIQVKELREGWPEAIETVDQLEAEGKLLVTRNKKDNTAKMVWPNDPSLRHDVDDEFKDLWHKIRLPVEAADLRNELVAFGLTPTSQVKAVIVGGLKEKKKKASRRGGKTTNTHMASILKDYSHKRPVK